jgi:DNA-binding CsgD family transcriptional regulator
MPMGASIASLGYIDRFIQEIDEAKDMQALYSAMNDQITCKGFDHFVYRLITTAQGFQPVFYLSSVPSEWKSRYKERNYGRSDVITRHVATTMRPFEWMEICPWQNLTEAQQAILNEARVFGLKAGGTVPIHGAGMAMALFTVSNNMNEEEFHKLFIKERHEIHLMATYFHECIMELQLYNTAPSRLFKLSQRELEILTWTADGKQAWDISQILSISAKTVEQHITNACRKLNVHNKTHAVALALVNGLITP